MRLKFDRVLQLFLGGGVLLFGGCVTSQPPAPVVSVNAPSSAPVLATTENPSSNALANRPKRGSLQGDVYQVKAGDTLYSIAWAAGQDYRTLAAFNHLQSPFLIHPGDRLLLRAPQATASAGVNGDASITAPSETAAIPAPAATPVIKPSGVSAEKPHNNSVDKPKADSYSEDILLQKPNNAVVSVPAVKPAVTRPTVTNHDNTSNVASTKPSTPSVAKPTVVVPSSPTLPDRVAKWQWPLKGEIIRQFSDAEHGNNGLDIAAPTGTAVVSAAQGQVVYAGSALRGYGQLIIVKHSDEYLSAYAHNSKLLVKEQQLIKSGQKIAEVGSTEADRSMLHFEIRYKGKSVDPLRYLPR